MSEGLSNILYGVSFFLNSFVLVGLWWTSVNFPETRRLWKPLALAWTFGLIADLAWGVLFLLGSDTWFDWIDYLYIARYLLVFLAFWLYPQPWQWRQWLALLAAILWGWIFLWLLIILPTDHPDPAYAWAGMVFPVFDVGILYAAVFRWKTSQESLTSVFFWLSLAMLSYGTANWFNYSVRVINPDADSLAALIFWLLSTACMGFALWRFRKHQS